MLWEFLAMIFSGLGAAGVALIICRVFKFLPKWLVPAAAGLGMLGFQVHSEYTWYGHTRTLLPSENVVVVAEVPSTAPYKPWTYIKPQILQFVAVDKSKVLDVEGNSRYKQTNLYFFERRMSAKTWAVVVDCSTGRQADATASGKMPAETAWHETPYSSKIAAEICPK
ncbi:hypothetical protein [Neisseria weaveri]|uniref:hypothetical protein n=1 Tax=Neisseria weaveri TaxID=28091 RepID=UPI000D31BF14|nr:hypothetical protein [Neisseria weaveri]